MVNGASTVNEIWSLVAGTYFIQRYILDCFTFLLLDLIALTIKLLLFNIIFQWKWFKVHMLNIETCLVEFFICSVLEYVIRNLMCPFTSRNFPWKDAHPPWTETIYFFNLNVVEKLRSQVRYLCSFFLLWIFEIFRMSYSYKNF